MSKHRNRIVIAALTLLGAVSLAACGSDGSSAAEGDAADAADGGITVVTEEFSFDPESFSVPADTDVDLVVDNGGGVVEHDLTIDEGDVHIHADAGESTEGTLNLPAGTYDFYCSVAGHRDSGMEGTLTVE